MMDDVTVSQSQSQFKKRDTPYSGFAPHYLYNLLIINNIYNIYNKIRKEGGTLKNN